MEYGSNTMSGKAWTNCIILVFNNFVYGFGYLFEWLPWPAYSDSCLQGLLGNLDKVSTYFVLKKIYDGTYGKDSERTTLPTRNVLDVSP